MLRFFILRIVFPVLLFLLVRSIFKSIIRTYSTTARSPQRRADPGDFRSGGELKRDPVCGTFVPVTTAVTKTVNGRVFHFCSTDCRDKYRVA